MSTPAVIVIALYATSCTAAAARHGRETRTNFFLTALDAGIVLGLLAWGGFFS